MGPHRRRQGEQMQTIENTKTAAPGRTARSGGKSNRIYNAPMANWSAVNPA